jgi:biopolymer transport protein ExbB
MTIPSDLIVPAAMWTLIAFSVSTWSLILIKAVQHYRISRNNRRFTKGFWAAANLQAAADLAGEQQGPAARLSAAGLQVLRDDANDSGTDLEHTGDRQDLLERALRQQIHKERRYLESGLALLASIGSTSPFVGLFGTVWGIMHALTDISKAGSASLEVVAGPIGEALVATGVGIAVAVPAVLAYNFFLRRLKIINADLDELGADLISLSRKSGFRIPRAKPAVAVSADRPAGQFKGSPAPANVVLPSGSQPA